MRTRQTLLEEDLAADISPNTGATGRDDNGRGALSNRREGVVPWKQPSITGSKTDDTSSRSYKIIDRSSIGIPDPVHTLCCGACRGLLAEPQL